MNLLIGSFVQLFEKFIKVLFILLNLELLLSSFDCYRKLISQFNLQSPPNHSVEHANKRHIYSMGLYMLAYTMTQVGLIGNWTLTSYPYHPAFMWIFVVTAPLQVRNHLAFK